MTWALWSRDRSQSIALCGGTRQQPFPISMKWCFACWLLLQFTALTRSKNTTGYSEWGNPKRKTLSYVLGMYETQQSICRDFFRHHIADFNAKCQDNKKPAPPRDSMDRRD